MNNISFIKKIVPNQKIEFYKWLKVSSIFIASFLTCAIGINFWQLYKISKLRKLKIQKEKEIMDFENIIKNKNDLKLELDSIENKITNAENAKINNKKVVDYLKHISSSIPNNIYLKNLSYDISGSLELKGEGSDSHLIADFVKIMSQIQLFKNVKLLYLKSLDNQNVENSDQANLEFLIRIKF